MARRYELPTNDSPPEDTLHGFCVICELFSTDISTHANIKHQNEIFGEQWRCYDIKCFEGTRIMAPFGTYLEELAKCESCRGVFYKHRLRNHKCGNRRDMIDEGAGKEYCLMCQFRSDDVDQHWKTEHFNNWTYRRVFREGIKILLPMHTNDIDFSFYEPCKCGSSCAILTYNGRIMRRCSVSDKEIRSCQSLSEN